MKLITEIEIDFLEDGESLSDAIKLELTRNIEKQCLANVRKNVVEQVNQKIDEAIQGIIQNSISETMHSVLQDILTKPRSITDKYGRVIQESVTLEDMLINKMNEVFSQKTINRNGQSASIGHGEFSEIQWFMESRATALVSSHVKKFSEDAEVKIKQLVEQKIKTEIADKLTNIIVNNSSTLSLKT